MLVLGVGRGVPGEEWVWKLGGGELGIDGAIIEGVWIEEATEGAAEEIEFGMAEL